MLFISNSGPTPSANRSAFSSLVIFAVLSRRGDACGQDLKQLRGWSKKPMCHGKKLNVGATLDLFLIHLSPSRQSFQASMLFSNKFEV